MNGWGSLGQPWADRAIISYKYIVHTADISHWLARFLYEKSVKLYTGNLHAIYSIQTPNVFLSV